MYVSDEYGEGYYLVRSNPSNLVLGLGFLAIAGGMFYLYRRQQAGAAVFGETVDAAKTAMSDLETQFSYVPAADADAGGGFGISKSRASAQQFYVKAKAVADASGGSGTYMGQAQMINRPLSFVYTLRDASSEAYYRVRVPKDGSPAELMGSGSTIASLPSPSTAA